MAGAGRDERLLLGARWAPGRRVRRGEGRRHTDPHRGRSERRRARRGRDSPPSDAKPCDPASFTSSCTSDGIHELRCGTNGYTYPYYCGIGLASGSVPSACDPDTGRCVPTATCIPSAFTEHCDPTGRYRITCDPNWGREIATACAGCSSDGGVVCN